MATLEDAIREIEELTTPEPAFPRQEPFNTMEEREGFIPPPDAFGAVLPRDIPREQLPGLRPKAQPRDLPDINIDLDSLPRIGHRSDTDKILGMLSHQTPEERSSFLNSGIEQQISDLKESGVSVDRSVFPAGAQPVPTSTKTSRTNVSRLPTLSNYLSGQTDKLGPLPKEQNISPLLNQVGNTLDPTQSLHRKFKDLGKVSPGDAAYKGAMLGGAIGLDQAGPAGALMGSGIGSMFARGIADVESGRAEAFKRRSKVIDVFNKLGVAEKDGAIKFKDVSFVASPDEAVKLKNTSTLGSPTGERSTFAIDKANPFSNRTTKMARGIALALNNGLLNYSDLQDPKNLASLDAITGYLVNAATKDISSIDTAKDRLKDIMKRMKLDETKLRGFLESIKGNLPEQEALAVKEGLELLYN